MKRPTLEEQVKLDRNYTFLGEDLERFRDETHEAATMLCAKVHAQQIANTLQTIDERN